MEMITLNVWGREIAVVTQSNKEIILELEDESYSVFSPLLFQESSQIRETIKTDGHIDGIGILEDSISGAYGKKYFNKYFTNANGKSPTLLDRLSFIGSDGLGAIEYKPSMNNDIEEHDDITFSLLNFKEISSKVYDGEISHKLAKLIAKSNSGAGGAKAKAVVQYNHITKEIFLSNINDARKDGFQKVIVKFNNARTNEEILKHNNELKMEYIYYLLARECGIHISDSWIEEDEQKNCYFITKRFDVDDDNKKHIHSLAGLLGHDAEPYSMGYEHLFRIGNMLSVDMDSKKQMFKVMVFNIVFANKDDHTRNFSFLMDETAEWSFAPAYDLTYAGSNFDMQWHQLTIDKKPTNQVRSLSIKEIAKLCNIKNPLEVFADIIDIKHNKLMEYAKEYSVEELAKMVLEDTKTIDKTFKKR